MKNITIKYKPIKEFLIEKKLEKGHSLERIADSVSLKKEKVEEIAVEKLLKKGHSLEKIATDHKIKPSRVSEVKQMVDAKVAAKAK